MSKREAILSEALSYAAFGWSVFFVGPEKRPFPGTRGFLYKRLGAISKLHVKALTQALLNSTSLDRGR